MSPNWVHIYYFVNTNKAENVHARTTKFTFINAKRWSSAKSVVETGGMTKFCCLFLFSNLLRTSTKRRRSLKRIFESPTASHGRSSPPFKFPPSLARFICLKLAPKSIKLLNQITSLLTSLI